MNSTDTATLRRSLESARAGIQAAIAEPAPTYRLAATWGGWVVIDDEADIIHRLIASDRATAVVEAGWAGFAIRPTNPPAPVDLEAEAVPTCDHCPRTQEDGDWCGECGCCTAHCERGAGCPRYVAADVLYDTLMDAPAPGWCWCVQDMHTDDGLVVAIAVTEEHARLIVAALNREV